MPSVLEPVDFFGISLRNRFVRSATWDGTADANGYVTGHSENIYRGLAAGGVGLIISGFAYISEQGQALVGQYGIHRDETVVGLGKLTDVAHQHGAKIVAQIVHAGRASSVLAKQGQTALAPSEIEGRSPHRAMTDAEVESIIDAFAAAARRAKNAGFDAVQLHGAHGYLMSQFFSPITNKREDRWGGSAENRRRFHVETVRRVRAAVGPNYPLLMKFGLMDDDDGGATLEEGLSALKAMNEAGLDGVEISGGIGTGTRSAVRVVTDVGEEIYYRDRTAAAKRTAGMPVIAVGGYRLLETAEEALASNVADLFALSRPLIREPGLINRWQAGDRRPATCISCNKCQAIAAKGEPLECGEDRRIREAAAQA